MSKIVVLEYEKLKKEISASISYEDALQECSMEKEKSVIKNDLKMAGYSSIAIAESYRRLGNIGSAIKELDDAELFFKEVKDSSGIACVLLSKANIARQQCRYGEVISYLKKAYSLSLSAEFIRCAAYSLAGIAETTRICGDYTLSFSQHTAALDLFSQIDDRRGIVWAYEGIAQIYKNRNQPKKAFHYFQIARQIADGIGDKRGLAYAYKCIGEIFGEVGEKDESMSCLNTSLLLFRQLSYQVGTGYTFKSIGDLHFRNQEYELAFHNYNTSFELFSTVGDDRGLSYAKLGLGKVLAEQNDLENARRLIFSAYKSFEIKQIKCGSELSEKALKRYALR